MRKEKFSYLILALEVVAIIYLHSVKKTPGSELGPTQIVRDPVPNTPDGFSSSYQVHQVSRKIN